MMKFNHWLPKLITKLMPGRTNAIVLLGTAYFREKKSHVSDRLIRHEQTHIDQQKRDGIKFYINYLVEYLTNRINRMSHFEAYKNISYEVEARKAE